MFYTLIIFTFGMYVGQEYRLLPSVRIMLERAITYINEQNIQYQAQAQRAQAQHRDYLIWRMFKNLYRY